MRPADHFKLIVGRDEGENNFLHGYRKRFIHMYASSHNGPLVLIDGNPDTEDLTLAARLTARFGQGKHAEQVDVTIKPVDTDARIQTVQPLTAETIPEEWYL